MTTAHRPGPPPPSRARYLAQPSDDRGTDPATFAECRRLAGVDRFDLDAAATAATAKAARFYTITEDGLAQPWTAAAVWVNPPYSQVGAWVAKAAAEHAAGRARLVAMLVPANRTEQRWWQADVEPGRIAGTIAVRFLAGRRRFVYPDEPPPATAQLWPAEPQHRHRRPDDRPPFGVALLLWPDQAGPGAVR